MSHRPLPWQAPIWQGLRERLAAGRLPHALLFTGPEGVGKKELALAFIQAAFCERTDGAGIACGQCNPCRQTLAGSHPDLHRVEPEEDAKTQILKVDQIRALVATLTKTSQFGGHRFALIAPADHMNENAANALLKTLEEPGPNSILILLSALPGRLLPTIRSRCQVQPFPTPDMGAALPWLLETTEGIPEKEARLLLNLNGGAPLRARRMAEQQTLALRRELAGLWLDLARGQGSLIDTAKRWAEQDGAQVLPWLIDWIQDLMRLNADPQAAVRNIDLHKPLSDLARAVGFRRSAQRLNEAELALRRTRGSLNPQLLYEDLFAAWQSLAVARRA